VRWPFGWFTTTVSARMVIASLSAVTQLPMNGFWTCGWGAAQAAKADKAAIGNARGKGH